MEGPNPRAVALWLAAAAVALFAAGLAVLPAILGLDAIPGLIVAAVVLLIGAGALSGMAVVAGRSSRR